MIFGCEELLVFCFLILMGIDDFFLEVGLLFEFWWDWNEGDVKCYRSSSWE